MSSSDTDCSDANEAVSSDPTGDCNDANASIRPGATETCNSTDDDCDGAVDEGVGTTWYRDADGDGYGTSGTTTVACTQPSGYVSSSTDCNDANGAIKPGATEVAGDSVDQNCDGAELCYKDADNDGYRPDSSSTVSSSDTDCSDANEAVSSDPTGDCNDANASIRPNASEACNSIDDDCDGVVDEGAGTTWYRDADADGYGTSSNTTVACSKPAGYSNVGGDCNDGNASIRPGASETCNGVDDDCDGVVDDGVGTVWYFDADEDGYGGSSSQFSCSEPFGYSAYGGDCNDFNANIYPGAYDVGGSGLDENCDGEDGPAAVQLVSAFTTGGYYYDLFYYAGAYLSVPAGYSVVLSSTQDGTGAFAVNDAIWLLSFDTDYNLYNYFLFDFTADCSGSIYYSYPTDVSDLFLYRDGTENYIEAYLYDFCGDYYSWTTDLYLSYVKY